jgi:hypothetical protein
LHVKRLGGIYRNHSLKEITMKCASTFSFVTLLVLLFLPTQSAAQELPYTEGTVWGVTFVKTMPGMTNDYLKTLAAGWRNNCEEAKKQGLILSYRFLSGAAANEDDWDLMLMVEYKNMAALDGADDKWEAISAKVVGSQEQRNAINTKRKEMREVLGYKIVREITLK